MRRCPFACCGALAIVWFCVTFTVLQRMQDDNDNDDVGGDDVEKMEQVALSLLAHKAKGVKVRCRAGAPPHLQFINRHAIVAG